MVAASGCTVSSDSEVRYCGEGIGVNDTFNRMLFAQSRLVDGWYILSSELILF